jgi:hypothetical protein
MQNRDSFYYLAIRTKLGEALRAQYELEEPLPERLITASSELGLDRGQLPEDE